MKCELTGTPENQIDPPEPKETYPRLYDADEVATDILEHGFRNFNYNDFRFEPDLLDVSESFDGLVELYASLKADNSLTYQQNCVDYIAQIDEYLHKTIRHWVQAEINRSTRKGLEK